MSFKDAQWLLVLKTKTGFAIWSAYMVVLECESTLIANADED